MGQIFGHRNASLAQNMALDSITLGTVLSNSDPHQMGRLKVMCPTLGDDLNDTSGEHLPWATKVSPFGGTTNPTMKRGPDGLRSKGPVAYGMWNVPRVGSTVLICCIDGDPYYRLWIGAIFDQGAAHTMPHGRYFYDGDGQPDGPLDSYEQPIEPLYRNQTAAFKTKAGNYEWRTRGADYSVAGNSSEFADLAPSSHPDSVETKAFESKDGNSFDVKNGYSKGRDGRDEDESSVYSWTSPGFHSISMDDRPENCRVRVRTTCGAQVLMDDTNERIYISTPKGDNWIEMDYNGDIDMYGRRVSLHATEDINMTADKSIRMFAGSGIHMYSKTNINIEAKKTLNTAAHQALVQAAPVISQNGAPAEKAKWTNRVPQHEPYARGLTKDDYTHEPEQTYDDPNVGKVERGVEIERGEHWRR